MSRPQTFLRPLTLAALLGLAGVFASACSKSDGAKPVAEPASAGATKAGDEAPKNRAVATLAGGCFWGMEELLRKQPGVLDTEVGYTGGTKQNPGYEDVSSGASGHAESVRVVYDPSKTSYEAILTYFFKIHDPTTLNQQGNDVGSQYRSAIFVHDAEQRRIAEKVKARVEDSGKWGSRITTQIAEAGQWYPAEGYHQDYLQKKPGGYTCHYERDLEFH